MYSLDNPALGDTVFIYNAGSLQLASDPQMESFTEIDGLVTPKFGVKPLVVCYKNGEFEILYAPTNSDRLLRSDGTSARPDRSSVTATSVIAVPDLDLNEVGNPELTPVSLDEPNQTSVNTFIKASRTPAVEIKPPQTESAPTPGPRSPSPRMTKTSTPRKTLEPAPIVVQGVSDAQITALRQEIEELKSIVQAMNRRNYKIYPVDLPQQIPVNGQLAPVISVDEIMKKMGEGQMERFELNPMLQAYAGSHRSNNRLLTFYGKNGDIYHVRADYDPKTNKINPPK